MAQTIGGEGDFCSWMEQTVEPFLKMHSRYGYFGSYDGTNLFYEEYRLPGADKCIVISHGFCEFAEKYHEVIYHFLNAGYSVYLPEHRGHGNSDRKIKDLAMVHVEDYEEYVRDFAGFLQKVVIPRERHRVLFAHSMGGAIGALAIERYPGMFEAAVFSSPMFHIHMGRHPSWLVSGAAEILCLMGQRERYAPGQTAFAEKPDFEGSSCTSRARYDYVFNKRKENPYYRMHGGSSAWVRASLRANRKLMQRKNLERIELPILLFAAGADKMVDNRALKKFAECTKRTRLIEVPEARHEIFNGDETVRKAYYEAIFMFLAEGQRG